MSDNKVSRRSAIQCGLTVLAGGVAAVAATSAQAQVGEENPKVSKLRVHYQDKWNAQGSHCGICANFLPPETCQVVAGKVQENGYCLVFALKDIDLNQ